MNILSRMRRGFGHFILSHILTREVVQSWKQSYIEDPLPQIAPSLSIEIPTQVIPAMTPAPKERHTGEISMHAVEEALQSQRKPPTTEKVETVSAKPLDASVVEALVKQLPPGELAFSWWDTHRQEPMGEQTQMFRATRKTGAIPKVQTQ